MQGAKSVEHDSLRWRFLAVLVAGLMISRSPHCRAQVMFAAAAPTAASDMSQPFMLPTLSSEVVEAIQDYRRYVERSQWEKAFKQLEKLTTAQAKGLLPDKDGVLVPPPVLLARLLAELPEEGKKAYRIFNDAEAKTQLDQAQGKEEADKLNLVASRYLFTSSGDVAANRLGDYWFERADFGRALRNWQNVLKNRPDSVIPQPQLLVKVAIAAARDGRWDEFDSAKQQLTERFADATVKLGGKNVRAVEHVASLAADRARPQAADVASEASTQQMQLATEGKPLWQFRWFVPQYTGSGNRAGLMQYDQMYGRQFLSDFVPPVTCDKERVYASFAGYDVAIDLKTGKLQWRSGRFYDLTSNAGNPNQGNPNPFGNNGNPFLEQSGIAATHDKVWTVAREISNNNNGQPTKYSLVARDPTTGKEVYQSKTSKDIRDWIISGTPAIDEQRIYLAASKQNQSAELHVLALSKADGKLLWDTKVGTFKNDQRQNSYMMNRLSVPTIIVSGSNVFVDTNAGSLVQLASSTGEINWGLNYASDTPSTDRYYEQPPDRESASPPILFEGVLYVKGMRSRRLYAVEPEGPYVRWSRPVSKNSVLCGVDRERIYLGGDEIMAFDLKTQKLLWSKPVPSGTSWVKPLMTNNRIYQFSSRGIFEIDKSNGDVVQLCRGADLDSLGGGLMITPNALVAVSNLAITAYPLKPVEPVKTSSGAGASN
jgi:outer membrane protein assembly factor BamB